MGCLLDLYFHKLQTLKMQSFKPWWKIRPQTEIKNNFMYEQMLALYKDVLGCFVASSSLVKETKEGF